MQPSKRFGLIGEADFLTNCLLQELQVAQPLGEYDPYDRLVGKLRPCWRVQVKTSGNLSRHKAYHVGLARRPRKRGVRCTASQYAARDSAVRHPVNMRDSPRDISSSTIVSAGLTCSR